MDILTITNKHYWCWPLLLCYQNL